MTHLEKCESQLRYAPKFEDGRLLGCHRLEILDGTWAVTWQTAESGQGVPRSKWKVVAFDLTDRNGYDVFDADALDELLASEEFAQAADELRNDRDDADAAETIQKMLDECPRLPDGAGERSPWEYISPVLMDQGITAETTDDELNAIGERLYAESLVEDYVLLNKQDLATLLANYREELQEKLQKELQK
jgi:hypothetical protein